MSCVQTCLQCRGHRRISYAPLLIIRNYPFHVFRFDRPVLVVSLSCEVTMVVLVWMLMSLTIVTGEKIGKKIHTNVWTIFCFEDVGKKSCHHLMVYGADFANCNGEYVLSNTTVSWATDKPVYKHLTRNR